MKQEVADFFAKNLSDELLKAFGFTTDFNEIESQIAAFKNDHPNSRIIIDDNASSQDFFKLNIVERSKKKKVDGEQVSYITNEAHVASGTSTDLYLKTSFPRSKKEGNLTLAQLDSGFIVKESGSKLLGDISLSNVKNVSITPYTEMSDPLKFIASFLVDEYNMKDPIVIAVQSKADKRHTFEISQGTYVKICGAFDWRINVRKLQGICPKIKKAGIKPSDFYAACRFKTSIPFIENEEKHLKAYARLQKLLKKNPLLEELYNGDKLPIYESPEMKVAGWYLRK